MMSVNRRRWLYWVVSDCQSKATEWVGPPQGQSKQEAIESYAARLGVPARVRESLTSLSRRVEEAARAAIEETSP
jgi:hypothetical protein